MRMSLGVFNRYLDDLVCFDRVAVHNISHVTAPDLSPTIGGNSENLTNADFGSVVTRSNTLSVVPFFLFLCVSRSA